MGLAAAAYKTSLISSRIRRNLFISGTVFVGAFALALVPEAFDRPLIRLINGGAYRSWLFDYFVASANLYYTFSGAALMAMIWYCWFENKNPDSRIRILVGTLGALAAGAISRFLQHTLPTHPRPYYDPALEFHRPLTPELPSNTWDSFPSDHVAVFAGLAVVLYLARPRFAVYAIAWTIIVESSRTYMGGHYPSDLIAGGALAAFLVWGAQTACSSSAAEKLMRWESASPALFYMIAFFLSYQIATLFSDLRQFLGPVRNHISSVHISAATSAEDNRCAVELHLTDSPSRRLVSCSN
jgi:membrane-associated phospholipid phosphatase